jgi:hypothetical protein
MFLRVVLRPLGSSDTMSLPPAGRSRMVQTRLHSFKGTYWDASTPIG